MPNKDGTGPEGKGPRTGRALGSCKETQTSEEDVVSTTKKGLGPCGDETPQGRGFGRGNRRNRKR